MSKIFNISSLDKSLGRIFSDFRNSNFKAHLLSLIEQIWELIWKFHLKSIVWHIKIDSLTALWIKWGQNEEKMLPAHFQLIRARFGSSRALFAKLRLGTLKLEIETARFQGIEQNQRKCRLCRSGDIEDETHFLFSCDKLESIRTSPISALVSKQPALQNMSNHEKFN